MGDPIAPIGSQTQNYSCNMSWKYTEGRVFVEKKSV